MGSAFSHSPPESDPREPRDGLEDPPRPSYLENFAKAGLAQAWSLTGRFSKQKPA